jgi:hybrid cluster-associated redox disulfide protein
MLYFRSSQLIPGKGEAITYYQCKDANTIVRSVRLIPATGEIQRIEKPDTNNLYNSGVLIDAKKEEFEKYWPPSEQADSQSAVQEAEEGRGEKETHFDLNMTIAEAMAVHPRVGDVFAAFHLGGCAHCMISEFETIGQACAGYGIDADLMLEVLETLMQREKASGATST